MLIELRIAACAAMLVIAAIIDVKKREIPDKVWLGFGALGVALIIIEFALPSLFLETTFTLVPSGSTAVTNTAPTMKLFSYLLGIAIIVPIAYGIYKTSLFGGADSKALIAIAVLLPAYDGMMFKLHGFTAMTVLTNALIVSMSYVVYNVLKNGVEIARGRRIFEGFEESRSRKALAFTMGYRSNSEKGYLFAMEGIDESGKRKFVFNPAEYDDFVSGSGKKNLVWVTHAMPFIVYLAIGFGITIILGDLLAVIIRGIVGVS